MNILVVYQSVVDMFGSFFIFLTTAVVVDGTRMSRDSIYDQFVCHVWLVKQLCVSNLIIHTGHVCEVQPQLSVQIQVGTFDISQSSVSVPPLLERWPPNVTSCFTPHLNTFKIYLILHSFYLHSNAWPFRLVLRREFYLSKMFLDFRLVWGGRLPLRHLLSTPGLRRFYEVPPQIQVGMFDIWL